MGCTVVGWESVAESGVTVIVKEDVDGFDEVSISHGFEGEVVQGDRFDVSVELDENLESKLIIRERGDRLEIGLENGTRWNGDRPRFEITMPELRSISGSGAADIYMEGFEYDGEFEVEMSGASSLEGDLKTSDLDIEASGASRVELVGEVGDIRIDASGASRAVLDEMPADDIRLDVSGASRASVHLSGRLRGSASGASTIQYSGDPQSVDVSTSGASSVRKD